MRKQEQAWYNEHRSSDTLPAMANIEPAAGVTLLTQYLTEHEIPLSGTAVDIGAGQGRNSTYLAELGFEVWALEYIESAIVAARRLAESKEVDERIHFRAASVDTPWQIEDSFFDLALDYFTGINIETKQGREVYRDEVYRTLKPGSYALVTACSIDDEWEKELIANHPGPEPNSSLWPQTGKFQKSYDETELRSFYKDFEVTELRTIRKTAVKLGREGTTTYFWLALRKPL
jgi:SAM-dependent methyltransferase